MKLINIKTTKKAIMFGSHNNKCFSIKTTPDEFEELKKTDVVIEDISVYDTFISITVNSERTKDLILKAKSMGIQVKYY